MSRTLAKISAPWFRRTRMRIFPLVLKILWAAALLAGATMFAHSQAPAPAKSSHAPGALPLTKFYDTPNLLPAGKPGKLIRSERFDEYVLPYQISAIRILYHSRSPSLERGGRSRAVPREVSRPSEWPKPRVKLVSPTTSVPSQFQGLPMRRISLNDSPRGAATARSYFWRRESRLSFPSFELRRC